MSKIYKIEEVLDQVKEIDGIVHLIGNSIIEEYEDNNSVNNSNKKETNGYKEGKCIQLSTNKYERNLNARRECIKHYEAICQICRFDFEKKYGNIGKGYIHVHHIIPLCEIKEEYEVDPIYDLIPVCPNCHAMLHYKGSNDIDMTVEKLREIIKEVNNS